MILYVDAHTKFPYTNLQQNYPDLYDINKNGNVGLDDFVSICKLLLQGKLENRSEERLFILKKYMNKLVINNSLTKPQQEFLNTEFKKLASSYITKDDYPGENKNPNATTKKVYQLVESLQKKGFNTSHIKPWGVKEKI